jgi:hypothetical protein
VGTTLPGCGSIPLRFRYNRNPCRNQISREDFMDSKDNTSVVASMAKDLSSLKRSMDDLYKRYKASIVVTDELMETVRLLVEWFNNNSSHINKMPVDVRMELTPIMTRIYALAQKVIDATS